MAIPADPKIKGTAIIRAWRYPPSAAQRRRSFSVVFVRISGLMLILPRLNYLS
jgi:hypothetical protein